MGRFWKAAGGGAAGLLVVEEDGGGGAAPAAAVIIAVVLELFLAAASGDEPATAGLLPAVAGCAEAAGEEDAMPLPRLYLFLCVAIATCFGLRSSPASAC